MKVSFTPKGKEGWGTLHFQAQRYDTAVAHLTPEPTFELAVDSREVQMIIDALAPITIQRTSRRETFDILRRLTEKVQRANDIQHSGGEITPEDWSELHQLTNEAQGLIQKH